MPQHPHQRLGFGVLMLLFEILAHYTLLFLFMMLVHMRFHTEQLCWQIDVSAVWIATPGHQYWSIPWYFRISERPAKITWCYINNLMQLIEAVHPHICHPDYFALPQVAYYDLGFDYNND